jgi:hypothetical protein
MGLFATHSINDTQHKCHSAFSIEYRYSKCHYAESRDYIIVMLGDVVLNVVMLSVMAPSGAPYE